MSKIMIVDDEPEIVNLFNTFLTKNGFEVIKCPGGKCAVDLIDSEEFKTVDLILLDRRMPEVDGIAVLEHLKTAPKKVPVIMLTGSLGGQAKRMDVDELLMKPLDLHEVLEKINKLIKKD